VKLEEENDKMTDASFGEFELIARLTSDLASREDVHLGVGDDCAIMDIGGDQLLLATCDSQVEGVHFTLQTSNPEQIGRKALAVNLSDIAAMGGMPRFALISLLIPSHISPEILEEMYRGLRQEAKRFDTAIVGGNIASVGRGGSSSSFTIDITILGSVMRDRAITRSGARSGDTLCVTGHLGDSAAGLFTLFHPENTYSLAERDRVQNAHRTPHPRIAEGRILSQFGPHVITAMLDISDGLSGDLAHLCECSQVGVRVELACLPLSPSIHTIAHEAGQDPLHWAMHGGEDYELLFTVASGYEQRVIDAVQTATGTPVTIIGSMLPLAEQMQLLYPDGHQENIQPQSWDHLKN
jgi:thiamine-monophosphate kinase